MGKPNSPKYAEIKVEQVRNSSQEYSPGMERTAVWAASKATTVRSSKISPDSETSNLSGVVSGGSLVSTSFRRFGAGVAEGITLSTIGAGVGVLLALTRLAVKPVFPPFINKLFRLSKHAQRRRPSVARAESIKNLRRPPSFPIWK